MDDNFESLIHFLDIENALKREKQREKKDKRNDGQKPYSRSFHEPEKKKEKHIFARVPSCSTSRVFFFFLPHR